LNAETVAAYADFCDSDRILGPFNFLMTAKSRKRPWGMVDKRFLPEREIINQSRRDVERLEPLTEAGSLGEHRESWRA